MSINRQIDKQDVVCTHNGILFSHKRNEVLVHATTWKDLENGMLRETTKRNRTNSGLSHLHEIGRLGKFIETASRFEATVGLRGGRHGELLLSRYRASAW